MLAGINLLFSLCRKNISRILTDIHLQPVQYENVMKIAVFREWFIVHCTVQYVACQIVYLYKFCDKNVYMTYINLKNIYLIRKSPQKPRCLILL